MDQCLRLARQKALGGSLEHKAHELHRLRVPQHIAKPVPEVHR